MKSKKSEKVIIQRIAETDDVSSRDAMSTIIQAGTGIIQLTQEQLLDIALSKKDIEQGFFIENSTLEKVVKSWLKER